MIVITKAQDVPYANDYLVEEEWYSACMPQSTKCCALRISYQVVFNKKTMMQKMIQTNVDKESTAFWTFWKSTIKNKNLEYKQELGSKMGMGVLRMLKLNQIKQADPTSAQDLHLLLSSKPMPKDHAVQVELLLQMNTNKVFERILSEAGDLSLEQMYRDRGDKEVSSTPWVESSDKAFVLSKSLSVEFQMPNNPLVKKCPATRTFKMIEKSETKMLLRVTTKCRDVSNSADFNIEEEWFVASLPTSSNSCAIRISAAVVFEKYTMMKSQINTHHEKESAAFWTFWKDVIQQKELIFKE